MRGLKVALIDRGDFAGATSSRSSKLIHGGLRYLPQGQLRLVYHALHERERLRRATAPHLVHPIRFLFPFYRGRSPGRIAISAGLILYDLFARMPPTEHHRRLSRDTVASLEPSLARDGLSGGALYYDGSGDDARITLENALDAAYHGAAVVNYVAIESFSRGGSRLAAADVRDLEGNHAEFEIRAQVFVNTAGPWVDDVRRMDDPKCAPSVRLSKGVHIVIDRTRLPIRNALALADVDGRMVFAIPHDGCVLVGTTDTDFDGDRDQVSADSIDISALTSALARSIPQSRLTPDDVLYSFAGLRALVTTNRHAKPSLVTREEIILESSTGLITVAGGKLTTHRLIAERVVNRILRGLGRRIGNCPTLETRLPGARGCEDRAGAIAEVSTEVSNLLAERYGTRALMVKEIIAEQPVLAAPLAPGAPAIGAEVLHAVRHEMARSVIDFLVRRTAMVWRAPKAAIAAAPAVARITAAELGWDRAREQEQLQAFLRYARRGVPDRTRGPSDGSSGNAYASRPGPK
jgi:glycerol-3-phosphate dehydrogenase